MVVRLLAATTAVLACCCLLGPSVAPAQGTQTIAGSTLASPKPPTYLPPTPEGYEITAQNAVGIATANPKVAAMTASHGPLTTAVEFNDDNVWQVGFKDSGDTEVVQVKVDPHTGGMIEAWTGYQVAWPMARGYEGQFGHILNAPYVWIPMAVIFFVGLFDWRRPGRMAHLDLLVLLSFGISHYFFNQGTIGVSVPLAYPPLIYLLARMLWVGFRGG